MDVINKQSCRDQDFFFFLFKRWCWFVFFTMLVLKLSTFQAYTTNWLVLYPACNCRPSDSWHQLTCTNCPQRYLVICSRSIGIDSFVFVAVQPALPSSIPTFSVLGNFLTNFSTQYFNTPFLCFLFHHPFWSCL